MTLGDMLKYLWYIQEEIKRQIAATPQIHPGYKKALKQISYTRKNLKAARDE